MSHSFRFFFGSGFVGQKRALLFLGGDLPPPRGVLRMPANYGVRTWLCVGLLPGMQGCGSVGAREESPKEENSEQRIREMEVRCYARAVESSCGVSMHLPLFFFFLEDCIPPKRLWPKGL
jgi:hypothetical protein